MNIIKTRGQEILWELHEPDKSAPMYVKPYVNVYIDGEKEIYYFARGISKKRVEKLVNIHVRPWSY